MRKILIFCSLLLVASRQALANSDFYAAVCNKTQVSDGGLDMDQIDWIGVCGALVPLVPLFPEIIIPANVFTVLGGLLGILGGFKGTWDGSAVDYTVAARDCLESFVTGEIDTSLFQQAQAAFSDAGLSSGSLNETLENSNQDTLEVVLDNAGRYYERIHQSQVHVGILFSGLVKEGGKKNHIEAVMQFYLDLLSAQSFAGLSIMVFVFAHDLNPLEIGLCRFVQKEMRATLENLFDNENEEVGIRHKFDRSPMATQWSNDVKIAHYNDCGHYVGSMYGPYCSNYYERIEIRDNFREKDINACNYACNAEIFHCKSGCDPDEKMAFVQNFIDDTLNSARNKIDKQRELHAEISKRIDNLFLHYKR